MEDTLKRLIIAATLSILAGCSVQSEASSESASISPTATPAPTHNYVLKEGQDYGYQGGISEEDAKNGKVSADVSMFRYLGEKEGRHTIQMLDNDGSATRKISCVKPCEFMKFDSGERVAYNPDSLGGAVMQDALAGELEVYKNAKK